MIVKHSPTNVVVIGGGITGLGIARDAALRGFKVRLFERGELGSGTSGYFHKILHSGGRYAIADPVAASECYQESQLLMRLAEGAVYQTGGLFVACNDEDAAQAGAFVAACQQAGIPVQELPVDALLEEQPLLSKHLRRVFRVADGYIDSLKMLQRNKLAAESADVPAEIYPQHELVDIKTNNHQVTGVVVRDVRQGEQRQLECDFLINAAGVWAGQVSAMAGVAITFKPDKGSMLALNRRYATTMLNRLRSKPGSGDILVDALDHSILGTTSVPAEDLDTHDVTEAEIEELIAEGQVMIPSMERAHIAYAYAGVRPLYSPDHDTNGRAVTRSYQILNHNKDGINNFVSVVGGKFTIYRLMAEKAVDEMCRQLDIDRPSQTATLPLS